MDRVSEGNDGASPNKRAKTETTAATNETKAEKAARLKASVKERLAKAKKLKEVRRNNNCLALLRRRMLRQQSPPTSETSSLSLRALQAKALAAASKTATTSSKKAKVFELDMTDTTAKVGGVALKNQPDVVAANDRQAAKDAAKARNYNPYLETYEDDDDDMGYDDSVKYKDNFRPTKKRGAFNWVKVRAGARGAKGPARTRFHKHTYTPN